MWNIVRISFACKNTAFYWPTLCSRTFTIHAWDGAYYKSGIRVILKYNNSYVFQLSNKIAIQKMWLYANFVNKNVPRSLFLGRDVFKNVTNRKRFSTVEYKFFYTNLKFQNIQKSLHSFPFELSKDIRTSCQNKLEAEVSDPTFN